MQKMIRSIGVGLGASCAAFYLAGCSDVGPAAGEAGVATVSESLGTPISVTFQDGLSAYAGTTDSKLAQSAPTTNYGSATPLTFDGDTGSGNDASSLLRWDISSIPSNATVQAVSITVRVSNSGTSAYPIFALKRSWAEGSVRSEERV